MNERGDSFLHFGGGHDAARGRLGLGGTQGDDLSGEVNCAPIELDDFRRTQTSYRDSESFGLGKFLFVSVEGQELIQSQMLGS